MSRSNIRWQDEEQETSDEGQYEEDQQESFQDDSSEQFEDTFADQDPNYDLDQQEEQAAAVMNEAVLRIEQANLYQTLLSHNLFGKGSARPEIIGKVQAEMRAFILSRLEILLGIKPEKSQRHQDEAASAFDEEQAEFLKALADRGLRRTMSPQISKPSLNPVQAAPMAPQIQEAAPPVPVINPVGGPSHTQQALTKSRPQQRRPQQQQRRPQQADRPEGPVGRKLANGNIEYNGKQLAPRKSRPAPARRRPSSNVSEIDGKDLSQAVNPLNPPKPMPSQAIVDQMHAQQVASITQDGTGKASMAGLAAAKLILGR